MIFPSPLDYATVIRMVSIMFYHMTKLYFVRHAEIKMETEASPDKCELTDNASDAILNMLKGI